MRYAITNNGVVTNLIELQQRNASDFPAAVLVDSRPVAVGDTYDGEKFYRDGVEVLTETECLQAEIDIYKAALANVGVETEEEVTDDAE